MQTLKRLLRALPAFILVPALVSTVAVFLWVTDLAWLLFGKRRAPARGSGAGSRPESASVVIPNWNGRDLLEKYLPSVVEAMAGHPENEIIVVDNGSTDGSAEFVASQFPEIKLVALPRNLGFGGGSNAGVRAAKNEIVILLNSDMRPARGFLAPLLEGFEDPEAFAVSCQIFFSDPGKLREETGLTQGWWQDGTLRVRHRDDPAVKELFPCFYGGGGSCAFDRRKFLDLGGFDPLLEPFYLEDTDLGYMAWKRGWKVFYQPRSVVYHEHRGTIGKRFTSEWIETVLKTNYLLFCWKNVHEARRVASHFSFACAGALLAAAFGDAPLRPNARALCRAFRRLPRSARSRWRARSLASIGDSEAFRRPMGGYFRDRFAEMELSPERLRVLFVSPYPICPPIHGGGVFMYQTLRQLSCLAETHVVETLDAAAQVPENEHLRSFCASAEWIVRRGGPAGGGGALTPYAVREFADADLEWFIHRQIFLKRIDILQLEYTAMAQYRGSFRRIGVALFEHDIYFQSVARGAGRLRGLFTRMKARVEYLRALRYELQALTGFDRIQVCTSTNRDYLLSFSPALARKTQAGLRAGVDCIRYSFQPRGREPGAMLFLGSFRHEPNRVALEWFFGQVMPLILAKRPDARLAVAGSDPPPEHVYSGFAANTRMLGYVEDAREPLARYSVFICPVLSGSGVRVKLLEAFAAGIPVVSTSIGAEGLARKDGEFCALADSPGDFAARVLAVWENPEAAARMAARARAEVEANWDMPVITARLVESYREIMREKRS